MQPKFTLKKFKQFFSSVYLWLFLSCFLFSSLTEAQILTTEAGTGYTGTNSRGAVNSQVSFIIENTNPSAVMLTQVDAFFDPAVIGGAVTGSSITLWYSATSLSGPMTTTGPGGWTVAGSGTLGTVGAAGYYTAISGMSFIIPANTTYRFAFQSTLGISYSNPGATPNTFTSGGVSLKVGDFQISGTNIGYAGDFPGPATQFNPRFFTGRVHLSAATPCSGTPAPGNTLSSVTTACAGTNFGLSLENPTAGSGVTYQWQSGPTTTGPWTDIAGATGATLSRNHTAATYYRCNVTCATGPATTSSNPVLVGLTPASACYCIPPATDCTDNDVITRVRISTLDNASTCSAGPPAGYGNFTALPAPIVFSGAPNPISVNTPTIWTKAVAVWIDYNQNGVFEASEFTNLGGYAAAVGQIDGLIPIPASALTGITRMRVKLKFGTAVFNSGQACTNASAFGETEDYNVNIQPCVPATIASSPTNRSIVCGGNTTFTASANGSLPQYSWQYRTSAAGIWQTVTNGGIYSGATTATLTLTNVSAAFSGYQYRALVTGGCSAVDFTSAATLTVTPIIPTVNPSSATICVGSVQQLTLTNTLSAPITAMFSKTGLSKVLTNGVANIVVDSVNVTGIPAGSVINNVQWGFNMTHTWASDVGSNITSPTARNLNLVWQVGGSTDDFIGTYFDALSTASIAAAPAPRTGVFAPMALTITGAPWFNTTTNNVNDMRIDNPNGFWKFSFYDAFGGDDGLLTDLYVNITYTAPSFAQGTWTGPAGTMYTDAGATTLYTGTPATTIYVKPTATGVNNYNVSFTTPTPCTSATTTIPVTVHSAITGLASSPATRSVCLGNSTTFTASTTGGTPVNYQWQLSTDGGVTWANISGATSATLAVNNVTNAMNNNRYRVTAVSNVCGSYTSASSTLTVLALPTVTISAPDLALTPPQTTVITGASTPAAAANGWAWTLNGAGISGSTNTQNVNINTIGSYQATVTDVNGCVNKSNILVIGSEASDRMWIYPNPTDGAFQVRLYYDSDVTERRRVTIYNMLGQIITSKHFTLADNTTPYLRMDFDLTNMQAGTYVVKVAHEFTGKVVSGLVIVQ